MHVVGRKCVGALNVASRYEDTRINSHELINIPSRLRTVEMKNELGTETTKNKIDLYMRQ